MATRELWYANEGPAIFDDTALATGWYPAPYDTLAFRAALLSQAYVTDAPVLDLEIARRMDIDGTPGAILKAGASGLPADSLITEDATYILISSRILSSASMKLTTTPGAGKIIQGDADGNFSWATLTVVAHNILSASHTDSLTASAILGDIIHGNVTPVWARLAGNITTTKKFLTQTGTGAISALPTWGTIVDGDVPATHSGSAHHVAVTLATAGDTLLGLSGQTLDLDTQVANLIFAGPIAAPAAAPTFRSLVAADLGTTLSPTFAGLTVGALAGVLKATAGVLAGSAVHSDLGSIGENDHHTKFTTTEHSAIGDSAPHHAAVTVSAPISVIGQALSIINDVAAAITEVDTGAMANSDTVIPTSKAVTTSLAAKLNITSLVLPFYIAAGTLDTIPLTADQKLPFFDSAAAAKNISLTT